MTDIKRIEIRKDMAFPSQPWCADLHWNDGTVWTSWLYNYRSKRRLLSAIAAVTEVTPDSATG